MSGYSLIEADVLAKVRVDACNRVPEIVARAPRELCSHRHEEVEDGPGKDDDVVNIHPT